MDEPGGQLSPDGRWQWDGREWVATGFAGLEPRINPSAVAAFVSGLVIPLWPLSSITAVILATVSMRQLRRRPTERGQGLAVAGLVLGIVGIVVAAIVIVVVLTVDWRCLGGSCAVTTG